jgi:cytochrome b6-f complex iron-sulfur subunit
MERNEFLKKLGIGGAALVAVYCAGSLGSCKKKDKNIPQAENKDFTLDLNNASYSSLKNNGGYVIVDSVVVAKTKNGSYVAVTQICSHQGNVNVVYDASNDNFYCSSHGARFNTSGGGLNSDGSGGLKTYNTTLSGTSLRVFS